MRFWRARDGRTAKLYRVLESFLKLVAIATVADIVPLTGENRVIVKHGLNGLGDVRNPGLRALLKAAGFADRVPDAGEVGFRIAPAINASGRMDSAGQAVRMFLTSDAGGGGRDRARIVRAESGAADGGALDRERDFRRAAWRRR